MMTKTRLGAVVLSCVMGVLLAAAGAEPATAQQNDTAQEEHKPEYSKGFLKNAGKVQKDVQASNWAAALEGIARLEALDDLTADDRRVIMTWKLTALQSSSDREPFIAAIEEHLASGLASPEQIGPMNQQLAAWYNGKKDRARTLQHYQAFVDATPNTSAAEYETLGRLYLQSEDEKSGAKYLGLAIDTAMAAGEQPKEFWFQLLDKVYFEGEENAKRLANLEALVKLYPKSEYYTRILSLYRSATGDDRVVMMNLYRLVLADTGLSTVGEYLACADTAVVLGSPGEAQRALERGMADGIVPNAGTNQQSVQEAKIAVARDRRDVPRDAQTAAANPNTPGEVHVKIGLGFFSIGDPAMSVESIRRGLAKGGVKRVDDANMLLGAALLQLNRREEAKAAFAAAAGAAGAGSHMAGVAGLWTAIADRQGTPPAME